MERVEELTDIRALKKIADPAKTIEKRIEQLQRIKARHFERAPAELLSEPSPEGA